MPENRGYLPEGLSAPPLYTPEMLRRAVSDGTVLEGTVQRCDGDLNLYLQLGSTFAKIPREEVTAPWISGADREIAVLSRVGKQVCFTVESLSADAKGAPTALLSRRKVQEQAMEEMRHGLKPGAVVVGKVVRMEPFGAFVDIGRGIVALLPTEYISAARIRHPNERFRVGQKILAVVKVFDRENRRITLTHKELLGTWLENASRFSEGDTVFDVLQRVCRAQGIHMESNWTPAYNSAYIEGIGNLYEFDCGNLSGWMYSVNGVWPDYGCSSCTLHDGDTVVWSYTCDLGRDVGARQGEP